MDRLHVPAARQHLLVSLSGEHLATESELAGDEAWALRDLAAEISRQTGRTIPYTDLHVDDYAAPLESFGLPGDLARLMAGWDVSASQGALFDDSRELSKLIGRPTTPMSETVADALEQADDDV